jgi:predicted 2-oxoglutarate/Fe(II)-dependent dioxygenase YbiX
VLRRLADSKPFKKINGFANREYSVFCCPFSCAKLFLDVFRTYAPRLYNYYRKNVTDVLAHDPSLAENFDEGAWAAMTIDFGPQTVTRPHTDFDNLAYGWSCITSLGDFDPHKGGHLVLWDINMVVTFPPGCTVFIPSAVALHSNTPISPTEHRYSVTQYSAAGLFRWVDNDFRSDESREQQASAEELEKRMERSRTRWEEGLALFPTYYEIIHT